MDMTPNLTLLVQIVHFFIAYAIISRFLLRPGYQVVTSEVNRQKHLKSRIVARQELIAHKQRYMRARWELFQDYFRKQKPEFVPVIRPLRTHEEHIEIPSLSEKDLELLSTEIVQELQRINVH
jgi:hypothetical protein